MAFFASAKLLGLTLGGGGGEGGELDQPSLKRGK